MLPDNYEQLKHVLLLSLLFMATYAFMYVALTTATVTMVATLVTVTPALVAMINVARGTVATNSRFWIALFTAVLGVILTLGNFSLDASTLKGGGLMFAFLATVTSALYRTRMDVATKVIPPLTISAYLFLTNGLAALCMLPWVNPIHSSTWGYAIWLGLAAAAANITFIKALHLIGSTRLSVITLLQRPLVIVLAALFLGESLSWSQLLGLVMVFGGIHFAKPVKVAIGK